MVLMTRRPFLFLAFITYIPESAGWLNAVSLKALGFKLNPGTKNEMKRGKKEGAHLKNSTDDLTRVDFEQEKKAFKCC